MAIAALCLAPAALWAQQTPLEDPEARAVIRMVQDASRGLQAGNAASFLRFFHRGRFEQYATLESHVVALTTQSNIASSIKIVEIERTKTEGEEAGYSLRVDWLLQLSVQETPGPLETRREVLEISATAEKKQRWRIIALKPIDFFRPQQPGQGP